MRLRIDRNAVRVHLSKHKPRYCPCRSGARQRRNVDAPKKTRKIAYRQSMFPASHQAPYPNQPQTCQTARITESAIPGTKHTPRLTTLIRKIVRRRRRCQCVGREIQRSPSAAATAYADPTHLFYQILIARLHLSVALSRPCSSAASKNQPGFLRHLGASFLIRVHRRDRQSKEDDCGAAQNCMLHNHLTTPWNGIDLKFPIFRPSTLLRAKLFRSFLI